MKKIIVELTDDEVATISAALMGMHAEMMSNDDLGKSYNSLVAGVSMAAVRLIDNYEEKMTMLLDKAQELMEAIV